MYKNSHKLKADDDNGKSSDAAFLTASLQDTFHQRRRKNRNLNNSMHDDNYYDEDDVDEFYDDYEIDYLRYLKLIDEENMNNRAKEFIGTENTKLHHQSHVKNSNYNFDKIDEAMLKAYEEEENLTLALEKEQDLELRSVLAQEAKLTKQLSVEQLKQYQLENDIEIEFDLMVS